MTKQPRRDASLPQVTGGLQFIQCPDGVQVPRAECFARCRMAEAHLLGRCTPLPFLKAMFGRERKLEPGRYSTTELIGPTRLAYLKRVTPYGESAEDAMWRTWGTAIHSILESEDCSEHLAEVRLKLAEDADNAGGQLDLYDGSNPERCVLCDLKTWGAYKVKKILRAGSMALGDAMETAIQVNRYRQKLERAGLLVHVQTVAVIIRDHGRFEKRDGIPKLVQLLVRRISDHWLDLFFQGKRDRLDAAFREGYAPPCKPAQRWGGRRCRDYCPVADACRRMSWDRNEEHPVFGWPSAQEEPAEDAA